MEHIIERGREYFVQYRTIIFFLFSGGTVAIFQLIFYAFLSRILEMQYLIASSVSFVVAVIFSFLMQKFVVFQNVSTQAIPRQFMFFSLLSVINLNVNGLLMIVLVEHLSVHDIIAQMITMVTIAVWSFFVYKHFIFARQGA